jgi:hypothetical protein
MPGETASSFCDLSCDLSAMVQRNRLVRGVLCPGLSSH